MDVLIYRPFAYAGVLLLERTPITANQISFLSAVFGLAAGWLIALGTPSSLRWGAAGVLLFNLLDCADGMLARRRGTGSLVGYMMDGLCNYVASVAILVGLGVATAARHDQPLLWWGLTIAAGASLGWWCWVVDGMRLTWMCRVHGRRQDRAKELAELTREAAGWRSEGTHRLDRFVIASYTLYVGLWGGRRSTTPAQPPEDRFPRDIWARANRSVLRLAIANGSSLHMTAIIAALVLNRPEWILWGAVIASNVYGAIVLLYRGTVRRRLNSGSFLEA